MTARALLAAAAALSAYGASAQSTDRDMNDREAEVSRRNDEAGTLLSEGAPNDRAMAGFLKNNVSVATEDGKSSISLALSFDIHSDDPDIEPTKDGDGTFYTASRTRGSLVASMPLEDDPARFLSTLFAGDSLVRGKKVKFAVSHLANKLGDGSGSRRYAIEAYERCVSDAIGGWLEKNPGSGLAASDLVGEVNARLGSPVSYQRALRNLVANGPHVATFTDVDLQCIPAAGRSLRNEGDLVDRYSLHGDEYWSLFIDKGALGWFVGADASVGEEDYAYLDVATSAKAETERTSWEIGAYAGVINWNATFSARARVVYGRTWKLPEDQEPCQPAGDGPAELCAAGPPERIDTGLASLEARHLLKLDAERTIALAPQLTYRFEDRIVGVEVPVYLAPSKDAKLTGGVKFAWSSKDDEVGVGVFVGVPFGGVQFEDDD